MKITHELEAAATFAILMQDVPEKSPGYMIEKYEAVKREPHPRRLLDNKNLGIFKNWMSTWHLED